MGRGPTRLTQTDVLCSLHSCPSNPSVLTSCLPAPAPHTSTQGRGSLVEKPLLRMLAAQQSLEATTLAPALHRNGGRGRTAARWSLWRALPRRPTSAPRQLWELPSSRSPSTICPCAVHQQYCRCGAVIVSRLKKSALRLARCSPREEKTVLKKSLMQKKRCPC